ncbi:unnamed protein product [marine sediment metagenome]|uniref:Uncharacterized protein n=1 Tax=marine sediment metagenome TaxID=412755 RepID=X0WZC5_9ZZZZ
MFVLVAMAVIGLTRIDASFFPDLLAIMLVEGFQVIDICLVGSGS